MTNNNPYLRNKISISLTLSAAIVLLLLASPLVSLSNLLLLQPVQAQTSTSFRAFTTESARGEFPNREMARLTFDAEGTATMTNGTFQITNSSNSQQILYSGNISAGRLDSNVQVVSLLGQFPQSGGGTLEIRSPCIPEPTNSFTVRIRDSVDESVAFIGPVKCDPLVGKETASQPSSSSPMTGTTSQDGGSDSDGDGISDSSDKCPHNSNHRCFKEEGDANTTTTTQQQPSSNSTGNQTR
jgi:hypothetical protein